MLSNANISQLLQDNTIILIDIINLNIFILIITRFMHVVMAEVETAVVMMTIDLEMLCLLIAKMMLKHIVFSKLHMVIYVITSIMTIIYSEFIGISRFLHVLTQKLADIIGRACMQLMNPVTAHTQLISLAHN